jgi:nucleoid-associated protein YgaU
MALSKVIITNVDTKERIKALFNPKEYTISKQVSWNAQDQKGLDIPEVQFDKGNQRVLSMELFFDTYENKENVKEYVKKIEDLTLINVEKHRPPIVLVSWGTNALNFQCVLEQMEQRYTMFTSDGTPVRAVVNVTFKEVSSDLKGATVAKGEKQSPDHTKVRVFKDGDTLQHLAYSEYEDPALWIVLANYNHIDDPLNIPAGTNIQIPPL